MRETRRESHKKKALELLEKMERNTSEFNSFLDTYDSKKDKDGRKLLAKERMANKRDDKYYKEYYDLLNSDFDLSNNKVNYYDKTKYPDMFLDKNYVNDIYNISNFKKKQKPYTNKIGKIYFDEDSEVMAGFQDGDDVDLIYKAPNGKFYNYYGASQKGKSKTYHNTYADAVIAMEKLRPETSDDLRYSIVTPDYGIGFKNMASAKSFLENNSVPYGRFSDSKTDKSCSIRNSNLF